MGEGGDIVLDYCGSECLRRAKREFVAPCYHSNWSEAIPLIYLLFYAPRRPSKNTEKLLWSKLGSKTTSTESPVLDFACSIAAKLRRRKGSNGSIMVWLPPLRWPLRCGFGFGTLVVSRVYTSTSIWRRTLRALKSSKGNIEIIEITSTSRTTATAASFNLLEHYVPHPRF